MQFCRGHVWLLRSGRPARWFWGRFVRTGHGCRNSDGKAYSLMELRTILEWLISPRLRETEGVTEVNSMGGYYKSFEVQIEPDRLADYGLTIIDVIDALEQTNTSAGGGYIVHHGEQRFIRSSSLC